MFSSQSLLMRQLTAITLIVARTTLAMVRYAQRAMVNVPEGAVNRGRIMTAHKNMPKSSIYSYNYVTVH